MVYRELALHAATLLRAQRLVHAPAAEKVPRLSAGLCDMRIMMREELIPLTVASESPVTTAMLLAREPRKIGPSVAGAMRSE